MSAAESAAEDAAAPVPTAASLPVTCPVLEQARQTDDDARRLNRSLRQLHAAMKRCAVCEHNGDCPALDQIHSRIQSALLEIYQQWDLA
jgi:hypothetical protein